MARKKILGEEVHAHESATAAFGALKNIFTNKYLPEELKGEVYKALICLLHSTVAKLGLSEPPPPRGDWV